MTTDPLVLENITKRFGPALAVDNISMRVGQGEILGFLGPNGAGKTTTLRIALGLISPEAGQVQLFGAAPSPASFGRIGFLPEERGLYRKSTARGAIAHLAQLNGLSRRDAYTRADTMMDENGLGEAKRKKVKALSKGMAQKVQLMAAIAHRPEFLILDEPFSGLDPVNQSALEVMIRDIASAGATIIFSTHVMEHAERLCDRIVLMSKGRKIFDGDITSALSKAERKLALEISGVDAQGWLGAFASQISRRDTDGPDYAYDLVLKTGADSQDVLEACVSKGVRVSQFEPSRATLHDAFVTLVGGEHIELQNEQPS